MMAWVAVLGLLSTTGCARRQYLTSGLLAKAVKVDPQLQGIRVYPSAKFISVYNRALGDDVMVENTAGGLQTKTTGEQRVYPIGRKTPGAILSVDTLEGSPLLWVTFDPKCTSTGCAYGFSQGTDGLYRLVHVPKLEGYSEPTVYRKRVTPRKSMRKSVAYSRSRKVPVYMTTRGIVATIALEIPKQDVTDTTVIVVPTPGVDPRATPRPSPPPAESGDSTASPAGDGS